MNTLGLVVISIVVGIAMSTQQNQMNALTTFVSQINLLVMKITGWVITISPIGIFFLVLSQMMKMQSVADLFGKLGLYSITILLGLFIHGFLVLPIVYFVHTRRNPYTYLAGTTEALASAFGTSSRYGALNT